MAHARPGNPFRAPLRTPRLGIWVGGGGLLLELVPQSAVAQCSRLERSAMSWGSLRGIPRLLVSVVGADQ